MVVGKASISTVGAGASEEGEVPVRVDDGVGIGVTGRVCFPPQEEEMSTTVTKQSSLRGTNWKCLMGVSP